MIIEVKPEELVIPAGAKFVPQPQQHPATGGTWLPRVNVVDGNGAVVCMIENRQYMGPNGPTGAFDVKFYADRVVGHIEFVVVTKLMGQPISTSQKYQTKDLADRIKLNMAASAGMMGPQFASMFTWSVEEVTVIT